MIKTHPSAIEISEFRILCLTADQIALLPLDGVYLVELSASETGPGEAAGGEGMIG